MAQSFGLWFSPLGCWNQVSPAAVRDQLRAAQARWGLPVRYRVDNGSPWGSWGDFPTELALWVMGLGVGMHWNTPKRPVENGVVERSQGTSNRWCEPWTCSTAEELQERLIGTDRLYRESYPYRNGQSRMTIYPGLVHSGRPYDPSQEAEQWQWSRVAEHLATYSVERTVDRSGMISLYNRGYYVGKTHQGKKVSVIFDPQSEEWVISDEEGRELRHLPAKQLNAERVMALNVVPRP